MDVPNDHCIHNGARKCMQNYFLIKTIVPLKGKFVSLLSYKLKKKDLKDRQQKCIKGTIHKLQLGDRLSSVSKCAELLEYFLQM